MYQDYLVHEPNPILEPLKFRKYETLSNPFLAVLVGILDLDMAEIQPESLLDKFKVLIIMVVIII